jgi:hypothetical protein
MKGERPPHADHIAILHHARKNEDARFGCGGVAACALAPLASARTILLGGSWQGRPIDAVEVGNRSGTPVLVVGCIHGNETLYRWSQAV